MRRNIGIGIVALKLTERLKVRRNIWDLGKSCLEIYKERPKVRHNIGKAYIAFNFTERERDQK